MESRRCAGCGKPMRWWRRGCDHGIYTAVTPYRWEARWTIWLDPDGNRVTTGSVALGDRAVPVVPCDDAAIERVAREICVVNPGENSREQAQRYLRAAGETP
jgi:hypothetical protein